MSIQQNNAIFNNDERLRKIAYRMDNKYHNDVIAYSEIENNEDGKFIPVNLLATHHQLNNGGDFHCRVSLSYTTTGITIENTGNCYVADLIQCNCSRQACLFKCDSVIDFTDRCLRGALGSRDSAYYGFLLFVLEAAKSKDWVKNVYADIATNNATNLAASLLHLYGYVDEATGCYIAFPERIENDLHSLKSDLISRMRDICNEIDPLGTQRYEDKMFSEAKKAFSPKGDGHRFWKRAQWMFCNILVYLEGIVNELGADQRDLFEKAKRAWENGTMTSPATWMESNPSVVK